MVFAILICTLLEMIGDLRCILLFLVMARLLQRYSLRAVLLASFLITAVRWLLLGNLPQYLPVLLLAQCMHAATFGAFHAACIHFVQRSFAAHVELMRRLGSPVARFPQIA